MSKTKFARQSAGEGVGNGNREEEKKLLLAATVKPHWERLSQNGIDPEAAV